MSVLDDIDFEELIEDLKERFKEGGKQNQLSMFLAIANYFPHQHQHAKEVNEIIGVLIEIGAIKVAKTHLPWAHSRTPIYEIVR